MTHTFTLQTRHLLILLLLCFFGLQFAEARAEDKDNTIYNDLLQKGVPLSNGKTVQLQQPVMADGLNSADQRKIIAGLVKAGKLDKFLKGGISDPIEVKTGAENGTKPKDSIGRRVDLYFIANGRLESVEDKNFLKQQVGGGSNKVAFLTNQELQARKLAVIDTNQIKERYTHADFDLFNMVQISGVGHAIQTSGKDSLIVAFILDPRFADDPNYPNESKTITLDQKTGKRVINPPNPYAGAGAYAKVTRLIGPTPQLFVEYHLVFDEPYDWFKGTPALISKLPQKFESDVHSFRRDLQEFEKQQKAAAPAEASASQTDGKVARTSQAADGQPVSAAAQPEKKKK